MRVLYGVTGCGLGHTMRARSLAEHLEARGHEVLLAASGRAVAILEAHQLDVVAIDGMTMRFVDGAMRRAGTALDLLRSAPRAIARNARVALGEVLAFRPEVVVTDFDSFAHAVGMLLGLPIVSVDHQHVLDRFRHPTAVRARLRSFELAHALVASKTPGCHRYIVTSFFFPEARPGREAELVGPIVHPEVERATPREGDHVVVYQTASGDPRLLPALEAIGHQRFLVYGLGREERRGHVELRPFDEAGFVDDLASARAVIANGGFTTLSEAIYLGKPVLSVPVRNQTEQELNAAYVDYLGAGATAERINPAVIRSFLDRASTYGGVRDARLRRGPSDAKRALDRALADVA